MGMWWEDYLGNRWDFTSDASGIYMRGDAGIKGLNMPPIIQYAHTSPAVPGSIWDDCGTNEREVVWPVRVWQDTGSQLWIDHDARFWDTLNPRRQGRWFVEQPNGKQRWIPLRYKDDSSQTFQIDPALIGWADYTIILNAEAPYWQSTPVRRRFEAPETSPFFVTSGPGVINISRGSSTANAQIRNAGDVDASAQWTWFGPFSDAQAGAGDDLLQLPFAVESGGWVYCDTRPTEQVVWRGENTHVVEGRTVPLWDNTVADVTGDCTITGFARLPFGETTILATEMTGPGVIEVEIPQEHYRAWG